jgi:hypothetical protein
MIFTLLSPSPGAISDDVFKCKRSITRISNGLKESTILDPLEMEGRISSKLFTSIQYLQHAIRSPSLFSAPSGNNPYLFIIYVLHIHKYNMWKSVFNVTMVGTYNVITTGIQTGNALPFMSRFPSWSSLQVLQLKLHVYSWSLPLYLSHVSHLPLIMLALFSEIKYGTHL